MPKIVAGYAEQWDFTIAEPLSGGTVSVVIAGKQADQPAVLKIHPPWLETTNTPVSSAKTEAAAYQFWGGTCAPELLAYDSRGLMLEHIMHAEHAPELTAQDITTLVRQTSQPRDMREYISAGIPLLAQELFKRHKRAEAQRHPEISQTLLLAAVSGAAAICSATGKVHNPTTLPELIHGDLKTKNILRRQDGSLAVIDPSPACGGALYDVALWAIDEPENMEERCEQVADLLWR